MITYLDKAVRASALEYLRRVLMQGKTLAKSLLQTTQLTDDKTALLSVAPFAAAAFERFDAGHVAPIEGSLRKITIGDRSYVASPTIGATDQLAAVIHRLLNSDGSICMLENSLAEASDSWLQRASSRIVTHGCDVLHLLVSGDSKNMIEQAIRESQSIPISVGALGEPSPALRASILATRTISAEQLAEFSRAVYCIFVGGYDGEGYVVWTRRTIEPGG